MWRYGLTRLLENGNGDVPCDAGKIIEKLIQGFAAFKIIKEILDRHARARKDWRAALDLGIDRNQLLDHKSMIRRPRATVANVWLRV